MKYFRHKRGLIELDSVSAVIAIPYSGDIAQYCVILKHASITATGVDGNRIETPMASITLTEIEDAEALMDALEARNSQ